MATNEQEVLLGSSAAGLCLANQVLEALWSLSPEKYFEQVPLSGFLSLAPDATATEYLADRFNALVKDDQLCFFKTTEAELRVDADLLRIVHSLGTEQAGAIYNGRRRPVGIAKIPGGVNWHVVTAESGAEYVAEDHRVWEAELGI